VDVGGILEGTSAVDLLIVVYFIGFFVLGLVQGTLRRLLGLLSMLFSFLVAANVARPLGDFLAANWTQFPPEYSYMVGFGTVFIAGVVASALVIQSYYHPQPLFKRARFADEVIGGILGLVEATLLFGITLVVLDSFFRIPGIAADPQELPFLRELWGALDGSRFADVFRTTLVPAFFFLTGYFVPETIRANYPHS
jgi:uncharacterized membrane protein required for colicin V production